MGARLALIVGSQCDRMPVLSFVDELATKLHNRLAAAGWQPAGDRAGPLLKPDTAALKAAVKEAFTVANDAAATLLIAFIGHGVAMGEADFYLLARDSPAAQPDSETAIHFSQFVGERLRTCTSLDGLVFLVDACQAQEGLEAAASKWTKLLADNRGRMEVLTASGTGNAYDGCFTRTILDTFDQGLPQRGNDLLCADLLPKIREECPRAHAQHLAYSSGHLSPGDPGLWLVPNPARRGDAVRDRPVAGLVDQLTERLIPTPSLKETLAVIDEWRLPRLLMVTGPAGCGKSTVLSVLIRPQLIDTPQIPDRYIQAAVFLDTTSTVETMAAECAAQLRTTVPGFQQATEDVRASLTHSERRELNSFEVGVTRVLARCNGPGARIRLIIDGLDQPTPDARDIVLAAIQQMTENPELGHVRVIAGVRSGEVVDGRPELRDPPRIEITPPTLAEIAKAATQSGPAITEAQLQRMIADTSVGGWLIARLLRESLPQRPEAQFADLDALVAARMELALDPDSGEPARLLNLIAAAGDRPVLPIKLLAAALDEAAGDVPLSRVRDRIDPFGSLISRGKPGTDQETLGISHLVILDAVNRYIEERDPPGAAHQALIDAYQRLSSSAGGVSDDVAAYWNNAAPRHYLGAGDPDEALLFLKSLNDSRAADNRDRWATWVSEFVETVGPDHPATLTTRGDLAFWRGETGDLAGAIRDLESLVNDQQRVLGPDHRNTMATLNSLALFRGRSGDLERAITDFEALVADQREALGPAHPDTLRTRNNLAESLGLLGDLTGAINALENLLPDLHTVFGPDHLNTLASRINLARWRSEITASAQMIGECEAIREHVERVLGHRHPRTLTIRGHLARCRADCADYRRAISEFEALLDDEIAVLGIDHPNTLITRGNLARCRYGSGDHRRATIDYRALVEDQRRILGPDHPDTLTTQHNLACSRADTGDIPGAIADLEDVLADRERVLGPDHPSTVVTRENLAALRLS